MLISIHKFISKFINRFTFSVVSPLPDLSVGVEIVISASGDFALINYFSWMNLFKISLDVNLTALLALA